MIFKSYISHKIIIERPLLVLGLCFFGINGVRWIYEYRSLQPLDIDEAGYLSFTFLNYYGLTHDGIIGFLKMIEASSVQAPLTSAIACLLYYIFTPNLTLAFMVPLFAALGVIYVTYLLGRTLGSGKLAGLSALLIGSCPVIINYSRSYHFAMPSTFFTTFALFAMLMSNRFSRSGWGILFGVSLGLMPLARTMTIAFIPGIIVGAIVYVIIDETDRNIRLKILAFSLFISCCTTATWLLPNYYQVFNYLLNFGYGSHSSAFGPTFSRFSFESWFFNIRTLVAYIYLPHFLVLIGGFLAFIFITFKKFLNREFGVLTTIMKSKLFPLLSLTIFGFIALTSTQNKGSAFIAPLMPAIIILAISGAIELANNSFYQKSITLLSILISIAGTLPSIDLSLVPFRSIELPLLGRVSVLDGRGTIQLYEASGGFVTEVDSVPINKQVGQAWFDISAFTAEKLARYDVNHFGAAFGFRHYLFNTNTVGLSQWLVIGMWTFLDVVDPILTGDSKDGYLKWLTSGSSAKTCILLTTEGDQGQFHPLINYSMMVAAAKEANFEIVESWNLPDGQEVNLWLRKQDRCQ